jgi:hypothetical protein
MREIRALVWKEWHETRLFLWIAWGLFIGLPIVAGFEGLAMYTRRFQFEASTLINPLGPVLAIIVGVAGTCRDLQPKLEDFWQSRPMGRLRLFIVKFIVGNLVVLMACAVPLGIELVVNKDKASAAAACWMSALWLAAYGIAVLAGSVFRRTAHAAAVSIVGLLLILALPIVFPPLSQFNSEAVFNQLSQSYRITESPRLGAAIEFAAGTVAVAVVECALGLAAYGIVVVAGCSLRRTARVAAVLIVAISLIYILPLILPTLAPIKNFAIFYLLSHFYQIAGPFRVFFAIAFIVGMVAVTAATGALSLAAVRYRWHVESGQPLIYGTVSAAILIVIGSASYQLGTNLPVLTELDLPASPSPTNNGLQAQMDAVVNGTVERIVTSFHDPDGGWHQLSQTVGVVGNKMAIGRSPTVPDEDDGTASWRDVEQARSERDPTVFYTLRRGWTGMTSIDVAWPSRGFISGLKIMNLWRHSPDQYEEVFLKVWHDRLYVFGNRTMVFDITDPVSPKRISDNPVGWFPREYFGEGGTRVMPLPPAPGLPAAERLKFAIRCFAAGRNTIAFDGRILCRMNGSRLDAMHLKSISDDKAVFDIIGSYEPTLVQSLVHGLSFSGLRLRKGLIYVTYAGYVSVFDVGDLKSIRLIAHFAAPGVVSCEPLADDRAIVSGVTTVLTGRSWQYSQKLWLLGPPPKH